MVVETITDAVCKVANSLSEIATAIDRLASVMESESSPVENGECQHKKTKSTMRTFKDGSEHIEVRCATCKKFLKWGE